MTDYEKQESTFDESGTGERKTGPEEGPEAPRSSGSRSRHSVEDRLDDMADRFARAVSDGVKRLEDAFDKGAEQMRERHEGGQGRIRSFFASSTGGAVLILVGAVWFLYAVGLFDNWVVPILLVIAGIYLMQRYKSND